MREKIISSMKKKMEGALKNLHHEFAALRTGRASTGLFDRVKVDYYGTSTPLNQVAALSVPDSRTILIQPWDINMLHAIEKAILASELGLTPSNDGKVIRISIPILTEERRRDLLKVAKRLSEEARIAIRNARRDANEEFKGLTKKGELSKDESKKAQTRVQEVTDNYIAEVEDILKRKERDIMEV